MMFQCPASCGYGKKNHAFHAKKVIFLVVQAKGIFLLFSQGTLSFPYGTLGQDDSSDVDLLFVSIRRHF